LIYRKWGSRLHAAVEVCPVNLPGRSPRASEPSFVNLFDLSQAVGKGILPHCDKPFAVFGHSFGAMLAFEVARYLRRQHLNGPVHLFVSGRRAPQVPDEDPPTYNLPRDAFIQELKRINGTPKEVLEHDELVEMFLPMIQADFQACQTYEFTPEPPLDCGITAFCGLTDDEETRERVEPWREQTTRSFSLLELPGDHFFIHSSEDLLLQTMDRQLQQLLRRLP